MGMLIGSKLRATYNHKNTITQRQSAITDIQMVSEIFTNSQISNLYVATYLLIDVNSIFWSLLLNCWKNNSSSPQTITLVTSMMFSRKSIKSCDFGYFSPNVLLSFPNFDIRPSKMVCWKTTHLDDSANKSPSSSGISRLAMFDYQRISPYYYLSIPIWLVKYHEIPLNPLNSPLNPIKSH